MKKIKGKDLKNLGFKKEKSEILFEGDAEFHYYCYDVGDDCFLITDSNDEKINGGYVVRFFEIDGIEILDLADLKILMEIIERGMK